MEHLKKLLTLTIFLTISTHSLSTAAVPTAFNVKDYGAKADGKNLDSPAINSAIDTCSKAGGGTVYFPAGTYLSGSIRLKSNITLYLDSGATIFTRPQT